MHIGLQSRSGFPFARHFNCVFSMFVVQLQWKGQETVAFFVLTFPSQGDRATRWNFQERSALIVLLGLIVKCPWCDLSASSGGVSTIFLSSDHLRSHCFRNRPHFFRQIMREQRIMKSRFSVTAPCRRLSAADGDISGIGNDPIYLSPFVYASPLCSSLTVPPAPSTKALMFT